MVSSRASQRPTRAPWRLKIVTTIITLIIASIIAITLDDTTVAIPTAPAPASTGIGGHAVSMGDMWARVSTLSFWPGAASSCAPSIATQ